MLRKVRVLARLVFGPILLAICVIAGSTDARSAQEGSYLYLGQYPDHDYTWWGNNDTAPQGVAHDGAAWYISATGTGWNGIKENDDWILWRIPVHDALVDYFSIPSDVLFVRRASPQVHDLDVMGFTHPGDIVCYHYENRDYLLVPMRMPSGPAIVAFEVSFLGFKYLSYSGLWLKKA